MTIESHADQVLSLVVKAGGKGDLIVDQSDAISLKALNGELEEYKVTSSRIFGLRVIKDDKVGTAYSEAADPDSLKSLVKQALTNASYATPEVHETILANEARLSTDDSIFCPLDSATTENKIQLALELERELASKDRVKNVPYNGVQDSTAERHIFSTAGLHASSRSHSCSAFAYALIEEGDKNAMEGSGQVARLFSDLDKTSLIDKVYQDSIDMLNGEPVDSAHYDVIFDKEMQVSLFSLFAVMFSGKSAKDGINPMRDKKGELIADPRLTISDRPDNVDGFGYSLFDDEGTPSAAIELIKAGELKSMIHNSMTASYFETQSTGHATRGPRSTLGVGLHQLEIAPGDAEDTKLYGGKCLLITDLTGMHSGANAISGEFSFGASGYLCENGERLQSVRNVTVAGNFYQMLQNINMIGNRQHWNWQRSALMPSIRFADVAISG
ncbi:TldD/PmbA family protein [Gammaproteobacteria bacterium]|nr:TldD/PmbA family protein [Gammaproteobacteria bacterium]